MRRKIANSALIEALMYEYLGHQLSGPTRADSVRRASCVVLLCVTYVASSRPGLSGA